jgi:hypothetical protein
LNKIRDKGKTTSAWKKGGGGEREGVEGKGRGWGEAGSNDLIIICTYE